MDEIYTGRSWEDEDEELEEEVSRPYLRLEYCLSRLGDTGYAIRCRMYLNPVDD